MSDFVIENGVLIKYVGPGGNVVVPDGVTKIEWSAFKYCSRLVSVTVPDGVKSIGYGAFMGCTSLTEVSLPDSVLVIDRAVFSDCKKLKSITLPAEIRWIREATFENCENLSCINIPEGLRTLSDGAFRGCKSLACVAIPDSVKVVEKNVFEECSALEEIQASDEVFSLVWEQFSSKEKLRYCCKRLTSGKELRDREKKYIVRSLDALAIQMISTDDATAFATACSFKNQVPLEQLDRWIADSDKAPAVRAFLVHYKNSVYSAQQIERMKTVSAEKELGFRERTTADWKKILKLKIENGRITVTGIKTTDPVLDIPSIIGKAHVTDIAKAAFKGCKTLREMVLPDGLQTIGTSAFEDCANLMSVTIPDSVKYIGWSAFKNCKKLPSIILPASLAEIGSDMLAGCSNLSDITIPKSVNSIAATAFKKTAWLNNQPNFVTINGILYRYRGKETVIVVPEEVTKIGGSAFYGCTELREVTVGRCVVIIDSFAFERCSNLRVIHIPDSVKKFGIAVFDDNPNVTIHAPAGSYAETYAKENNIPFEAE